jgi:hypothetical protein
VAYQFPVNYQAEIMRIHSLRFLPLQMEGLPRGKKHFWNTLINQTCCCYFFLVLSFTQLLQHNLTSLRETEREREHTRVLWEPSAALLFSLFFWGKNPLLFAADADTNFFLQIVSIIKPLSSRNKPFVCSFPGSMRRWKERVCWHT